MRIIEPIKQYKREIIATTIPLASFGILYLLGYIFTTSGFYEECLSDRAIRFACENVYRTKTDIAREGGILGLISGSIASASWYFGRQQNGDKK